MSRKKQPRFDKNKLSANLIEQGKPLYDTIKGHWNGRYFPKNQPIVLELCCGKGEYSVGLAKVFPQKNFIGIDIKGDRLAVGCTMADIHQLTNVCFLRTHLLNLEDFFDIGEVSEIWLTFPDPRPRLSDIKRRVTHKRYLVLYKNIIASTGRFHLKTDNEPFFDYSIEQLQEIGVTNIVSTKNLYQSELNNLHFGIKTRFEEIFTERGFCINYLSCNLHEV